MRFPDPQIDEYRLNGKPVLVVREDLVCPWPGPNFSKIRGLYKHLIRLKENGITAFASQDTSISRCGWGCSYVARELGMTHYNIYARRSEINFYQQMSRALGGVLVPVHGHHSDIMRTLGRRRLPNTHFLPIGLSLMDTLEEHRALIKRMDADLFTGSVVVCASSGTISAGLAYGMSTGSIYAVMSCSFKEGPSGRVEKMGKKIQVAEEVFGRKAGYPDLYVIDEGFKYTKAERIDTPFPCDLYLDRKAWRWLEENINTLKEPVVFWNIGGEWNPHAGLTRSLRGDGIVTQAQIDEFLGGHADD